MYFSSFFFHCSAAPRDLPSFPTRRSSDLFGPHGNVGAHLTEVADHLDLTAGLVKASLAREESDEEREAWFTDELRRELRSEEHTSELQSRPHLVCRLLLEKKKKKRKNRQR